MSRTYSDESNIEDGQIPQENEKYSIYFNQASIRAAFVRKVFGLVFIMLTIVAAFSAIPLFNPEFADWCRIHWGFKFLALAVFLSFYLIIFCCSSLRRRVPINLILLGCFTVSAAVMTMFIVANYTSESVFMTFVITAACSLGVILFATFTRVDLTSCMGIAFLLGLFVIIFGFFAVFFAVVFQWQFIMIVYSGLAALVTMFYLAIDIQLLMGGRRVELSAEEYIFASMEIFMDILNLFLLLLNIFGNGR